MIEQEQEPPMSAALAVSGINHELVATLLSQLTLGRYLVETAVTRELLVKLEYWLLRGNAGGLVWAWFRLGKTCGCRWVLRKLSDYLGYPIGYAMICAREQLPDERQYFFRYLLKEFGHKHADEIKGEIRTRDALVALIVAQASSSPLRTFIVFFDEAQGLIHQQFIWLRELDNEATMRGCRLFLMLEGDDRLPDIKSQLITDRQEQVCARYMAADFIYRGLFNETELSEVLVNLAELESAPQSGYTIMRMYSGIGMRKLDTNALASAMWRKFDRLWIDAGLGELELPMTYVCSAAAGIFATASRHGWSAQPSNPEIDDAIRTSGFMDCLLIRQHRKASGATVLAVS